MTHCYMPRLSRVPILETSHCTNPYYTLEPAPLYNNEFVSVHQMGNLSKPKLANIGSIWRAAV